MARPRQQRVQVMVECRCCSSQHPLWAQWLVEVEVLLLLALLTARMEDEGPRHRPVRPCSPRRLQLVRPTRPPLGEVVGVRS